MTWISEREKREKKQANAKRQKAYRARMRDPDGPMIEWLKTVIDVQAKCALKRLARHYGVTQRAALERIIDEAERREIAAIAPDKRDPYYRD